MELWPTSANQVVDTWWRFSPDFVVQLLDTLGFRRADVHRCEQRYEIEGPATPLFTIAADRV